MAQGRQLSGTLRCRTEVIGRAEAANQYPGDEDGIFDHLGKSRGLKRFDKQPQ